MGDDMADLTEIENLWAILESTPYPKTYVGCLIDDIDLTLLDTFTAGSITTFLSNEGKLDIWRTAILGLCYRDLTVVTHKLDGIALDYFQQFEIIARLVLEAVRDTTKN